MKLRQKPFSLHLSGGKTDHFSKNAHFLYRRIFNKNRLPIRKWMSYFFSTEYKRMLRSGLICLKKKTGKHKVREKAVRRLKDRVLYQAPLALYKAMKSLHAFEKRQIVLFVTAGIIYTRRLQREVTSVLLRKFYASMRLQLNLRKRKRFLLIKHRKKVVHMWADTKLILRPRHLFINIYRTFNNIFVSVIDFKGRTLFLRSSGHYKFKGSRRVSFPAAAVLATKTFQFLLKKKKCLRFHFIIRSSMDRFAKNIFSSVNYFMRKKLRSKRFKTKPGYVLAVIRVAHNGIRKRKARRV